MSDSDLPRAAADSSRERSRPHTQGVRLLVVDDDPAALQALLGALVDYQDVSFAASGADALHSAAERVPDLILLDAEMPGMNGLAVLDALRSDARLCRIPVIFVTSQQSPEAEAGALEHGAEDFIRKPVVAARLNARIRARLRSSTAHGTATALPDGASDRARLSEARVLVVDDDVSTIRSLRRALSDVSEFYFARTGDEAIAQARHLRPDLILMDALMPGLDGFTACARLKNDPELSAIPVIFVTRFGDRAPR